MANARWSRCAPSVPAISPSRASPFARDVSWRIPTEAPPPPGSSWSVSPWCERYFPRENPIGRRIARQPDGKGRSLPSWEWWTMSPISISPTRPSRDVLRLSSGILSRRSPPLCLAHSRRRPDAGGGQPCKRKSETIAPDQPMNDVKTMREVIAGNISQPRFYTLLLAILRRPSPYWLAATGLYGVLSHSRRAARPGDLHPPGAGSHPAGAFSAW